MTRWTACTLYLLLAHAACAADVLISADGARHEGAVEQAADGKLHVGGAMKAFDPAEVERVRFAPRTAPPVLQGDEVLVQLRNGDRLRGRVRLTPRRMELQSATFGAVRLDPAGVARLACRPLPQGCAPWTAEAAGLRLTDGTFVPGRCLALGPEDVTVRHPLLNTVKLPRERVALVEFAGPPVYRAEQPALQASVVMIDGQRCTGQLAALDGAALRLLKPWGLAAPEELTVPRSRLAEVFFVNGRVRYASEVEPSAVVQKPYFSFALPWRRDASLAGSQLRIRGEVYERGLCCPSRCELTLPLDGAYRWFRSDIGIDAAAGRQGSVTFEVYRDSLAGEPAFRSGVLRGGAPPQATGQIDVAGAKRLILVVDYADGGGVRDHAVWGNALLVSN